jgi:CRISPR-associated protein Csb2
MLALEVELLTGRYVAKQYDDHASAEWPPHPARVFSALAAAHFEDPVEGDDRRKEREALDWLARQPAPSLHASGAARRSVLDAFVPTNDKSVDPSVGKAVHEVLFAADGGGRAVAQCKLEKLGQAASQPVAPTENQRSRLTAAIEAVERELGTNGASGLHSALEALHTLAHEMGTEPPSKLLMGALNAVASLKQNDTGLAKQLARIKRGLQPGKELLKRAVSVLPAAGERKQARAFPSVYAYDPIVQFIWPQDPEQRVREALDALAGRVTRLGHSSSLVRLAWVATSCGATWITDPCGPHTLRWVSEGQLSALDAAYQVHRGTANRVLPSVPANYRCINDPAPPQTAPASNVFGADWIVFELLGKERLPIVRAVDVASALRGASLAHAGAPPPEVLSGHGRGKAPSERPHVAYVALPFVGFPHSDGSILGVAVVLPNGLVGEERTAVLRALGSIRRLTLPPGLEFNVRRVAEPRPHLRTLDPLLWCGESVVWGTVTPILLDRFPGNLKSKNPSVVRKAEQEAQEAIAGACERIGLPRPRVVSLAAPCFRGSAAADQFRRRDRRRLPPRVRVHALIDFGQRIRGPVLLGAGRHVGLGLSRPLPAEPQS